MIPRLIVILGTIVMASMATAGPAAAAAPAPCTDVVAAVSVFKKGGVPLLDWRENLAFDGDGTMWVSHIIRNEVEGYAPDGTLRIRVKVASPGGIRRAPDGLMYVNSGTSPLSTTGSLMRFDPADPAPTAETFVSGLRGINGLAVDDAGSFYFGREFAANVLKIRADGTTDEAWTAAANVSGTNGVTIIDGDLFTTRTFTLDSPIVRVPLDSPSSHSVLSQTSPVISLPKGLDDLEPFGDDVVATGFVTGELVRVDRQTGEACILLGGLLTPTSVRRPYGFGSHDPDRELFVTEASGRILRVTVGPR